MNDGRRLATLRLPLVVSSGCPQSFLKCRTVEAPKRHVVPSCFPGMLPAVASLPSVLVQHFSNAAASTRVRMSSFDIDCAKRASIDGMEKAPG